MVKLFKTVVLTALTGAVSFSGGSYAQDDSSYGMNPFFIGVKAGGYFANKKSAEVYNGFYSGGMERVLSTQFYRDQIDQELQYSWGLSEFPENLRYTAALQLGATVGYNVAESFALYADVDIINLKVQDFITFAIDDPNNGSPEPTYEAMPILGEEKRLNINLGFQNYLGFENNTYPYWSMGVNVTSTRFENNTIKIRNLSPIYIGDPLWIGTVNPNNGTVVEQTGRTRPGGVGYGGFGGFGIKFKFNEEIIFDVGYNIIYTTIKLTDYQSQYVQRGLQHSLFARILWG